MHKVYKSKLSSFIIKVSIYIAIILCLLCALYAAKNFTKLWVDEDMANVYCRNIFPYVAFTGNSICNFFYFSVSENLLIVLIITTLIVVIAFMVKVFKWVLKGISRREIIKILKVTSALLVIATLSLCSYQLMHGINYKRTSVIEVLKLNSDTSYSAYAETLDWAYNGMVSARAELGEDYFGVAHQSTNFDTMVYDANMLVDAVSDEYDLGLSKNFVRAKAVSLSNLWSYTEIEGVYSVLLGEANLNTDYLDVQSFPVTLCHEICHAKGYAREYDCNMLAVISCIVSTRADFRYAGFYYIFVHLYNDVAAYAKSEGEVLPDYFGNELVAGVYRDTWAGMDYENSLKEGFIPDLIARFSNDVNDQFLESNGQEGGVATYYVHPDFYVNFFITYVRGK